jgi:signal transduction histidine kinase
MIVNSPRKRYILALSIVFILLLASQILVQYFLNAQQNDAKIINIAGRQRMLSQKIVKLILFNHCHINKSITELQSSIRLFNSSHSFIEGKAYLEGIRNTNTENNLLLIAKINTSYKPLMKSITHYLITNEDKEASLNEILALEKKFLPDMNALVTSYQNDSKTKINQLKNLEFILFVLTLLILLLEVVFIFTPLISSLLKSNQLLEQTSVVTKTGGWEYDVAEQSIELSVLSSKNLNLEGSIISLDEFCELFNYRGLKHRLTDSDAFEIELPLKTTKDSNWILLIKKIDLLKDDKTKIYGIIRDITLDKEIERYQKSLEDKNDSLMKLNYGLTHDIKNHTANVIGLLNMLKKHEQKQNYPKLREVIGRAESSANQLNQILSDFLYLSRTKEELEKSFTPIDEKKIINAIETEIQFIKFEKIVELSYNFNTKNTYYSNHIIKIILVNLISNSIKYCKPESTCVINVSVVRLLGQLHLQVSDNGIGMDLNNPQNEIFKLFKQLDIEHNGFGIGLSVLKKIVEQQNGEIKLSSTPNVGTTFDIYIPVTGASNS